MNKYLKFSFLVFISCVVASLQAVRLREPLYEHLIPSYQGVKSYVGGFKPYWQKAKMYGRDLMQGGLVGAGGGAAIPTALYLSGGDFKSALPSSLAWGAAAGAGMQLFNLHVYRYLILNSLNKLERGTGTQRDLDNLVMSICSLIDTNNYLYDYLTDDEMVRLINSIQKNRDIMLEMFKKYLAVGRYTKIRELDITLFTQ